MEERKNAKWKTSSVDKRVERIRIILNLLGRKLPEKQYDEFLTIMKAYKDQKVETDVVLVRLREILKGNKTLIREVNRILPSDK